MALNVHAFVDEILKSGSGKTCTTKLLVKKKSIEKIQRYCMRLNGVIVDLTLNKVGGPFALKSCLLYDAMVYKFGRSTHHQKFWKSALQIYSELKRINQHNLRDYFKKFVKTLENGNFSYRPSGSAVCYLGCLILERILRLDRLRIYCFRAADASMGYVELEHLLTFNLMSIAIASDVAKEALINIRHLLTVYDTLVEWLRLYSDRFPRSSGEIPLSSFKEHHMETMRVQKLESVRSILRLLRMDEVKDGADVEDFDERLRSANALLLKTLDKTGLHQSKSTKQSKLLAPRKRRSDD